MALVDDLRADVDGILTQAWDFRDGDVFGVSKEYPHDTIFRRSYGHGRPMNG
jgi:hypothetical protein